MCHCGRDVFANLQRAEKVHVRYLISVMSFLSYNVSGQVAYMHVHLIPSSNRSQPDGLIVQRSLQYDSNPVAPSEDTSIYRETT